MKKIVLLLLCLLTFQSVLSSQIKRDNIILEGFHQSDALFGNNFDAWFSTQTKIGGALFITDRFVLGGKVFLETRQYQSNIYKTGISTRYYIKNELDQLFFWENYLEVGRLDQWYFANDIKFGIDRFFGKEVAWESNFFLGLSKNKFRSFDNDEGLNLGIESIFKYFLTKRRKKKKKTQPIKKGTLLFSATVNEVAYLLNHETSIFNINLNPNIALFLNERIVIGSHFTFTQLETNFDKSKFLSGKIFGRYYFKRHTQVMLFAEIASDLTRRKDRINSSEFPLISTAIYSGIGVDLFISQAVALELTGNFLNRKIKDWRRVGMNLGNFDIEQYSFFQRSIVWDMGFKFFIAK